VSAALCTALIGELEGDSDDGAESGAMPSCISVEVMLDGLEAAIEFAFG